MSRIHVDNIYDKEGSGAPSLPAGAVVTGVSTFSAAVNVNSDMTFDGSGNNLRLNDNSVLEFGTGNDLNIFHNTSLSVIRDGGAGGLLIDSDNEIKLAKNGTGNDSMAVFTVDGSAELYYDGVKKIETTSDGVTVTGKVGIGSDTPTQELTVNGADPVISVQEATASSQVDIGTGTATGYINIQKADGTRTIQLNGGSDDSYINAGDVGIGTANPDTTLHVHKTGDGQTPVMFETGNATGRLRFYNDSDGWSLDSEGDLRLVTGRTSNATPTRLTITSTNGYLKVPGVYNNTTSNAANVSVPNSDGQIYRSTSSIKYKDNVTTLTDALADKILECRPVSYTSKCANDDNTKINYGLIAEEVNAIDPSLVFLDGTEPEGVQYDRFIPHLINLVKRQQQAIQVLEAKVAALEGS